MNECDSTWHEGEEYVRRSAVDQRIAELKELIDRKIAYWERADIAGVCHASEVLKELHEIRKAVQP